MNKVFAVLLVLSLLVMAGCVIGEEEKSSDALLKVEKKAQLQSPIEGEEAGSTEWEDYGVAVVEATIEGEEVTCEEGYRLEDGVCVKEEDWEKIEEKEGQRIEGEGSSSQAQEGGGETGGESEGDDASGSANYTVSPEEVRELIDNLPEGAKEAVEGFIGNEGDFALLLSDLEKAGKGDELKERFAGMDIGNLNKVDPLLAKGIMEGNKPSWVAGLLDFPGQVWGAVAGREVHTYQEGDYRIEKLETVWEGDSKRLYIYFRSPAALYTYVALQPLTVFVDLDNDGDWDVRYNVIYNEEQGKGYFYIKKRGDPQMLSRELEVDIGKKRIGFPLGEELGSQRAFIWIGEESTGLRYPKANDLVLFLSNGKMVKNIAPYLVVLVDKLKVYNDGDTFQEGEIFFSNLMLFSWPLERIKAEEAQRLLEYKREGVVEEEEIPHWFAYWLLRADTSQIEGLELQKTSFPMLKWVEMKDGDEIFTDDNGTALSAFPAFASRREWMDDVRVVFMATYVGDYDDWPSTITDKTGWLLRKFIEMGIDAAGPGGKLAKTLAELMYYGASGEHKSFSSLMEATFDTIFSYFGRPDLIGAPSKTLNAIPYQDFNFPARDKGAEVVYALRRVDVPTVPLRVKVNLKKVHVKDRSDGLRGEYYLYGRVCTDVGSDGLRGGSSFAWPSGKTSNCTPEKMSHGYKKVWDGDKVAKNLRLAEGTVRAVPFIYIELQSWDEDKENWGDDDDPMGLLTRVILLDEDNFQWRVDSNRPYLYIEEVKDASKVKYYYNVEVR